MAYEHDVFLSYTRRQPVLDWVRNHFYPRLEEWLGQQDLPHEPSIFVDWEIEAGSRWEEYLKHHLSRSRCIVAILSPPYFRSKWCLAEWCTMQERERACGLWGSKEARGLNYPVVFNRGDFPGEVMARQLTDLSKYNYPYPAFASTLAYLEFHDKMEDVAQNIAEMIRSAPPWSETWPIMWPSAPAAPERPLAPFPLTRLGAPSPSQ